ncbi:intraflagellar transport protein 57 homolog isoform X1 [Festucalex cinctus]
MPFHCHQQLVEEDASEVETRVCRSSFRSRDFPAASFQLPVEDNKKTSTDEEALNCQGSCLRSAQLRDTMQTCAPSWEASADRTWNQPSANNLSQYRTGVGSNWPTSFPGQGGICYQNVSPVSQAGFSPVPQGGNYGHELVSSRVSNYNMGQNSSVWNTGASSCNQRHIPAYQNPSGAVHGHAVGPEHHKFTSRFYQKSPPPPYAYNHITTGGQSIPSANTNQTPWQHPDTRSALPNTLEFQARQVFQEETQWQVMRRITQTIETQARVPDRAPVSTQVWMPERTQTMPENVPTSMQFGMLDRAPVSTQVWMPERTQKTMLERAPRSTQVWMPERTQTTMPKNVPTSTQVRMPETIQTMPERTPMSTQVWMPERTRTTMPKNVPTSTQVRMPETIQTMPERTPMSTQVWMPERTQTRTPEGAPTSTQVKMPERTRTTMPDRTPTSTQFWMPERAQTTMLEKAPMSTQVRMAERTQTMMAESAQVRMPETIQTMPERTPMSTQVWMPERTQTRTPEGAPTSTQVKMPERTRTTMPDRTPTSTQFWMPERAQTTMLEKAPMSTQVRMAERTQTMMAESAQVRMPETIQTMPERTPTSTQVRMPERTQTTMPKNVPTSTQVKMPERTRTTMPDRTPTSTQFWMPERAQTTMLEKAPMSAQVRMPERTPTSTQVRMSKRKRITQNSPDSSPHPVRAPEPLPTVCAAIREAAHVPGESSHLSKPENRSRSQHQTPTEDVPQPTNLEAVEPLPAAPSSASCSAQPMVAIMPPVAEGSPELAGQLLAAARGPLDQSCTGQQDPCAGDKGDQAASPVRKRQQRNVPQSFQPEEPESPEVDQSERPVAVQLKSLPTRKWTQEDLAVLIRDTHQAQMKSPMSSVLFNWKNVSAFWKHPTILLDTIRVGLYEKIINEASSFCNEHLSLDSAVLSEAMCDLNLSGLQVLQEGEGEGYSEAPYSSFWRNINPQLDDIDKEFGLERNLLPRLPSAPATAEDPSPEPKASSLEGEPQDQKEREQKLQHAQEPELDSAPFVPPSEDPDAAYSFVIKVLPQEQAKAIYDGINLTEEAPAKEDLKGSMETDPFDMELESFFEHWKDVLSDYEFFKNQDAAEGIGWADIDLSLSMDVDNHSTDSNRSQDASPRTEQKDDQETGNFAAPDYRESENIIRQDDDQEMENVCQGDHRELAYVSQKDDQRPLKGPQEDEQAILNVARQEDQETGKVPRKDDNQETAIDSQQKHVQEMAKVSQPVLVFPSKVSPPPERWTLQDNCRRVEVIPSKRYRGKRRLRLSLKKKRQKAKQSGISVPCLKKLKTKRVGKDAGKRAMGKEAPRANRKRPVELVLFGSAGGKRNYALVHHAPEILSVRPKGSSSIKQRIYEDWCRPPTRMDGKNKFTFQKKSYMVDMARKEPPLPTLIIRKDNGRMSLTLNKRKSKLDGPKKDAGALKQAADVLLKTASDSHRDKRHRVSERLPWDHHLCLVAMGTYAGATAAAAAIATGSS